MGRMIWTKIMIDEFIRLGNLTEAEEQILRLRASNWTITQMEMALPYSRSSINRMIATLKEKYDEVEPYSPILKKRPSHSITEEYLDTH